MNDPGWRTARDVLDFNHGRKHSCPACPFPIQPGDSIVRTGRRQWSHAFCVWGDE